jgi:hypothetical protein
MAGLSDQIKNEKALVGGRKRRIPEVLSMLDAADQKALQTALDDKTVKAVTIQRALAKRGITLSATVISNYRNGDYVAV